MGCGALCAVLALTGCKGAADRVDQAAADQRGAAKVSTQAGEEQLADDLERYAAMLRDKPGATAAPQSAPPADSVVWLDQPPAQPLPQPVVQSSEPSPAPASKPSETESAKVTEGSAPPAVESEETQTNSTATVSVQPQPLSRKELAARLADELRVEMDLPEQRMDAAVALAGLTLIDPQFELAEGDLIALPSDQREAVLALQRFTASIGRRLPNSQGPKDQIEIAAANLAEQTAGTKYLRIRNPQLCEQVSSFGVYQALANHRFLAGRENPVIVYAELDNFQPEAEKDGQFSVKLTQEIVLYNEADGLAVWRVKPTQSVDRSRNRRRDFFVTQIIKLPSRLSVGKYVLSVNVTDEHSGMVDEAKIPIQIVADRTLAE